MPVEIPNIIFVTSSQGKAREVSQYTGLRVAIPQQKLVIPELQLPTSADVVKYKTLEAYRMLTASGELRPGNSILTEDTSLEFEALRNHETGYALPGPYIKAWMDTVGNDGLIRMLDGFSDRRAVAKTAFGLTTDGKSVTVFEGETQGTIATEPRGDQGFSWDPIFEPIGRAGLTWGEVSPEIKAKDSMRVRALREFEIYTRRS